MSGPLTTGLASACAAIAATVASVPSIVNADSDTLATLATQIATAQGWVVQVVAFYDTAVAAAGLPANFASGLAPATLVANVNTLLAAGTALNQALDCQAKLGRLAKNIAQITT